MINRICDLVKKGALIVDVRSHKEFKEAHNPKSLNIPIEKLSQELCRFPLEKPVIVCCASGWRSHKAALLLKRYGVKSVYNACSWQKTLCSQESAC